MVSIQRKKPMSSKRSIIDNSNCCYLCGSTSGLTVHHCLFGTAGRKKADQDRLTVKLCYSCHEAVQHPTNKFDLTMQNALKKIAQEKWEQHYGNRDAFIKRYGKSYL